MNIASGCAVTILQEKVNHVYQNYDKGIGNEKLYELCGNGINPDANGKIRIPINKSDEDILIRYLSAQLWLIGRGYAASPERRNYGADYAASNGRVSLSDFKKSNGQVGNGTSSFFDDLAENIIFEMKVTVNDDTKIKTRTQIRQAYIDFVDKVDNLRGKQYSFKKGNKKNDEEILEKVVDLVESFNKLLKDATEACDEGILDDYDNQYRNGKKGTRTDNLSDKISFCSKFLHFHLPSVVFIYDSFSEEHLNYFNGRRNDAVLKIEDDKKIIIARNDVKDIKDKIKSQTQEDFNKYVSHCCRAYLVAKALYGNPDYEPDNKNEYCNNLPRIIDMLALIVNN